MRGEVYSLCVDSQAAERGQYLHQLLYSSRSGEVLELIHKHNFSESIIDFHAEGETVETLGVLS